MHHSAIALHRARQSVFHIVVGVRVRQLYAAGRQHSHLGRQAPGYGDIVYPHLSRLRRGVTRQSNAVGAREAPEGKPHGVPIRRRPNRYGVARREGIGVRGIGYLADYQACTVVVGNAQTHAELVRLYVHNVKQRQYGYAAIAHRSLQVEPLIAPDNGHRRSVVIGSTHNPPRRHTGLGRVVEVLAVWGCGGIARLHNYLLAVGQIRTNGLEVYVVTGCAVQACHLIALPHSRTTFNGVVSA